MIFHHSLYFFNYAGAHQELHSFPTRRSSDLSHAQRAHPVVEPPRQGGAASLWGGEGHRRGVRARTFLESPQLVHGLDRKSTRLNSSHGYISYAVFCLKKKNYPFCLDPLLSLL